MIHAAKAVASTIDPHQTFLKLVGEEHLDEDFLEQIHGWQWEKYSLTGLHLALKEAPNFTAAASDPEINKAFVYVLGFRDGRGINQRLRCDLQRRSEGPGRVQLLFSHGP